MISSESLSFLTDIYGVKQLWIMALLYAVVNNFPGIFAPQMHITSCDGRALQLVWNSHTSYTKGQCYQYFPSLSTPQKSFLQLLKCWKKNNFLLWHLNGIIPCEESYWDICWKSTKIIWTYFELILSDSSTFNLVWKTATVENRC